MKGLLQLDPNDRNTYQQGIAGGECRKTSDCGGHIIAAMFKGAGEAINLVPMDRTLNGSGGEWYKLEQEWKNAIKSNQKVEVNITVEYKDKDLRPNVFYINYSINGIPYRKPLRNTPTGK